MANVDSTRILVVDDLPEKLLVYRSILEELDLTIQTASSGEEALRLILQFDYAVILLDVNMPGMTGFEAASLIRRRKRSAHTPIIFLTAFADDIMAAEGYAAGAVDYIPTPVVPEVLRAKVRVFVDLYRMAQQVRQQAEERVALAEERTRRAAAEEATARSQFLADASRALADSLEPERTARALARQMVPFLADLAVVTLIGEPGQPWRTELAWSGTVPSAVQSLRLVAADSPHDPLRDAVERAMSDGAHTLLEGLDIPYPEPTRSTSQVEARIRSAVVVPLQVRGRTLGVLTLTYGPSGRQYGPSERSLAFDLAYRAGIALDNARLHEELERADRSKNEFLSMLAHELRNPLAPIRNAAYIARKAVPNQPALQMSLDVIDRQLAHMVRLVDDLLDVSRITGGKIRLQMQTVDLAAVAAQAVEASRPLIDQLGHRLHVSVTTEPLRATGDPARLAQVVTNLLTNAAKYTEPGGHLSLVLSREGSDAVIRVRDSGVGIPPEMLTSVFDLFTQVERSLDRSQGGLGVGLTLVKRLVELHGGSVRARSDGLGRGSEFVVRLPAVASEVDDGTDPVGPGDAASPPSSLATSRVLLVEDNVDGAETLAILLRLAGHEVRTVHDGPSAVAAAAEFVPDFAVLDIGLPGLDGYEVARRLRAAPETRSTILIAVTGYGREEDRRQSSEAGFDYHLVKPVEFQNLQRILGLVCPSC